MKEATYLLEEFEKVERYLASCSGEVPGKYLPHFEHFADFLKGFMKQNSAVRYEQEELFAYRGALVAAAAACISQEALLREWLKPKVSGKQAVKAMKNIEVQLGEILGENKVVSDELYRVLKRMERKIRDVTTETKRENVRRKKRNRDGHTTVKE